MDNPGFSQEDVKTPSTGDQSRKDLDPNGEEKIQQSDSQHSPNTQEITAIIHPEPPEITKESKETETKSEKIPSKNGHHNESSHNSQQSEGETAPPIKKDLSSTIENATQTSDGKTIRSNSLTNGHSVPNDNIRKESLENEFTAPEKITQEAQLIKKQGEGSTDENFQSSDSSVSIPEAETLASNRKSGWYYALLAIFFLGFFLALTLGLIFGRENNK